VGSTGARLLLRLNGVMVPGRVEGRPTAVWRGLLDLLIGASPPRCAAAPASCWAARADETFREVMAPAMRLRGSLDRLRSIVEFVLAVERLPCMVRALSLAVL